MRNRSIKNVDDAETLALKVLQFIISDSALKDRFIAITGMAPSDLKEALHKKEFLGGVLDFILGNEVDLLSFCEQYQVNPEQPLIARRLLPGFTDN